MNQPLLHDTCQYSPGGLVVSVTDSGGGGTGFDSPHITSLIALSDTRRDSKIMYFLFTLQLKKKNNNKYQILNKPVVILKF